MTRKDFIRMSGILGIGIPLHSAFVGCSSDGSKGFDGKVIIIGSGAGGMTAGYLLHQKGIEFEILEASSSYGGRMKRNTDFADFPIPLSAEWLHTNVGVFEDIVNDTAVDVDVQTVGYTSNDIEAFWDGSSLSESGSTDSDRKFVDSTWFDFFEEYIYPSIADNIRFDTIVETVDYSQESIKIATNKDEYLADKVIVSVPLKILKDGDIEFTPAFPEDKQSAIDNSTVWSGFKAFFEFSEKFYHTALAFDISPETDGQKLYYNASFGQDTNAHILGLFTVGKPANEYGAMSNSQLRDFVLAELDEIYSNKASQTYVKHMSQNWNNEPFIRSGYMTDHEDWQRVRTLSKSIDDKIYFAGGPYTDGMDWVGVHAAADSAKSAVNKITS